MSVLLCTNVLLAKRGETLARVSLLFIELLILALGVTISAKVLGVDLRGSPAQSPETAPVWRKKIIQACTKYSSFPGRHEVPTYIFELSKSVCMSVYVCLLLSTVHTHLHVT